MEERQEPAVSPAENGAAGAPPVPEGKQGETPRQAAYDWLESLVTAIVTCILVFLFLFRVVNVDGTSMVPTLHNSDKIVITRLLFREYRYGDVVVLTKQTWGENSLVKRVIATEGQTISFDFEQGIVYVDGEALEEPYIAELTHRALDFQGEQTVPEGCVFCMGDNRNASTDSRRSTIGMIDTRCILGKAIFRLWPLNAIGGVA